MTLVPGTRLGPYEILAPLGAGGMGEVYRARDTKLDRDVAVKVLPAELAGNPEALSRLKREAQLLASLNHPNIAAIYGIEESGGIRALVMELVEGDDVSALIARGPLPLAEALPIARQIAEALEAAHEQGIVHRDLKPANVKVRADGAVKVLDFGLAKAMEPSGVSAADPANSPTLTARATQLGMILGTAGYMAPEQARGKAVDKRADIWAFGVVVYEMLAGRRLFSGEEVSDVLAAVLRQNIDLGALPVEAPVRIRRLLSRCLDRDVKRRLRDIGEARIELEAVAGEDTGQERPVALRVRAAPRFGRATPLAGALALGAALGVVAWRALAPHLLSTAGSLSGPLRLSIVIPDRLKFLDFNLTPDGRSLLLLARERAAGTEAGPARIYVRAFAGSEFVALAGTEGALGPGVSVDSRWLYFRGPAAPNVDTLRIARVPLDGSAPPVTVATWDPSWSSFSVLASGELVVTLDDSSRLLRIPVESGLPGPPIPIDAGELQAIFTTPTSHVIPGGSMLANFGSYRSGRFQTAVGLLDLVTGKLRLVVDDARDGAIVGGGKVLIFGRGDALLAVDFDPQKDEVRSAPRVVLGGVRVFNENAYPAFRVSDATGVVAFPPGGRADFHRRLVRLDAGGRLQPWSDDQRYFAGSPSVSGDGSRMAQAVVTPNGSLYEIWISDVERPLLRRLLSTPGVDSHAPQLSRDGSRLAYRSVGNTEKDGLYVLTIDSGTAPLRIAKGSAWEEPAPTSWSPDGRFLLAGARVGGQWDVVLYRPDGPPDSPGQPLLASPIGEGLATFSPDGTWILYIADESGHAELRICRFEAGGRVGPSFPISRGAVSSWAQPHWRRDGRAVYYSDGDHLLSVAVTTTPRFSAAPPVPFADLAALQLIENFDVLPDGGLLVVQRDENEGEVKQLDLIIGGPAGLAAGK